MFRTVLDETGGLKIHRVYEKHDVATICKARLYPSFFTSSSFTMFPEFRRGQRNSSVSAPSSFTAMATVASDSEPEGEGGESSPKDHNFECSSCLENLQSLQEHLISHLDPTIMGFSSLLANSRLNLLRVDDARNLLGHLGLLQTTITGFPMVSEMDTDVTNATALVHCNAFVRSSASCTG